MNMCVSVNLSFQFENYQNIVSHYKLSFDYVSMNKYKSFNIYSINSVTIFCFTILAI